MNGASVLQQLIVRNPHFLSDTIKYLGLSLTEPQLRAHLDGIKSRKITDFEKLQTLIDRLEFIDHLVPTLASHRFSPRDPLRACSPANRPRAVD